MNLTGGSVVWNFDVNKSKFDSKINEANKDIQGVGSTAEKSTTIASRGFQTLARVGMAAVIAASAAVGYAITKNIGNAVRRVDTLNNFPRVMANLGYGADEARKAINTLDQGVRGLPTSLDNIARAMQAIAPSTKSLDEATKITLAFNNALLAGGAPMEIQATAMTQFSQAISKGKPDMIEWRSLAVAMPGQLDQITQSLGYGRGQWQKMAKDISDGERPFSDVLDAVVKLNEKGLGKFPSFADQAKNSTQGLGTALANANTAITRGIGNIIQALGAGGVASAITSMGKAIENALKKVEGAIIRVKSFLNENELALFAVKGAAIGLAVALGVALVPVVWGLVTAIGAAILVALPFIVAGAAIGAIAFVITKNWDKVRNLFVSIFNWFKANWMNLLPVIFGPFGMAAVAIIRNWDKIKSWFSRLRSFLSGVLSGVDNAIIKPFKTAFDWILKQIDRVINGFRRIRDTAGSITGAPGRAVSNISGLLGRIPGFATGGIVTEPTLAMVGEAGAEAIIPLKDLDKLSNQKQANINISLNMSGVMARSRSDLRDIAKDMVEAINEQLRAQGAQEIGGGRI